MKNLIDIIKCFFVGLLAIVLCFGLACLVTYLFSFELVVATFFYVMVIVFFLIICYGIGKLITNYYKDYKLWR